MCIIVLRQWRYFVDSKCLTSLPILRWILAILHVLHIHHHDIEVHNRYYTFDRFLSFGVILLRCFSLPRFSAEIAKELPEDSYGMIFGVNTFFAYCLQSILTAIVVSDAFGLGLNIFQQMNIYGGFLGVVGFLYFLLLLVSVVRTLRCSNTKDIVMKESSNTNLQKHA